MAVTDANCIINVHMHNKTSKLLDKLRINGASRAAVTSKAIVIIHTIRGHHSAGTDDMNNNSCSESILRLRCVLLVYGVNTR